MFSFAIITNIKLMRELIQHKKNKYAQKDSLWHVWRDICVRETCGPASYLLKMKLKLQETMQHNLEKFLRFPS